ncbi:hypothetical protein [Herbaspirillum sp. 1173]|uniref:rolling circle replication-associated protein n=1 Tax=Herbaspirillum sp. 1173 TaxID=2817734 RepID=UPI00286B58B8|nr:hypothetical protein [Herbaspirillum sp. 1173]
MFLDEGYETHSDGQIFDYATEVEEPTKRGEGDHEKARIAAARRAKTKVRRLAKMLEADCLLTLTYRECMTDYARVEADFKAFRERLRSLGEFHYVATLEVQKRGALHVHIACQQFPAWLKNEHGMRVRSWNLIRSMWRRVVGKNNGNVDFTRPRGRIGILSYFSTVLEEKYPGNDARVRIEQDGLSVRLIVESDNGNREVIERALQEYEMVVRGDAPVDSLFQNKVKIVELQTELRIAQLRVENQRDIISLQGEEIKSLRQLIGHSLSQSHPIAVNVSPVICVSNAVQIRNDVPEILLQLQRLSELTTDNSQMQLRLLDMQDAFAALGEKSTPDDAKASSAMKKLKAWLDDAAAVGSSTNSFLQKVGDGLEVVQKLAKHYNAVAEWCGAPQVPRIFLGED